VLPFGLGVDKAVAEVNFPETFGLVSQICFLDASELQPVLELVHSQLFRLWDVLPSCKADNVANILGLAFMQTD
jgi:hypothetical protein